MTPPPHGVNAASWLFRPVPKPDAAWRILCFPYAGGSAHAYLPWSAAAPDDVEILCLRTPGRGDRARERSIGAMAALVGEIASVVEALDASTLALFGHSFGSLVAFEVCRELRRRDAALPRVLFVSGRHAPSVPTSFSPLHQLSNEELLQQMERRYGRGVPDSVMQDAPLAELLLAGLRSDLRMDELYSYRREAPLPCPIFAFAGSGDTSLSSSMVDGWGCETAAAFGTRWWRGGHFFIDEHRREMLGLMRAFLGRTSS